MKAHMTNDLRKSVEAEIKQYGSNTSFVTKINKMLEKDFKDYNDAEKYANNLGLGRTIFMGNMGLSLRN